MEAKFFDSLFGGDSAKGVKLCMGITEGDFWSRPAGCHTIYRGQDGKMDYDNIQAAMDLNAADVAILAQDLPPNTIWHYIRRRCGDCGLESPDSPACIIIINSDGDMIASTPNVVKHLTAVQLSGGRLKLRWHYYGTTEEVKPTGFKIFMDSGSGFDFGTPDAIVSYRGAIEHSWTSPALVHGQRYKFIVRSYTENAGQTINTNYVAALADALGPPAASGLMIDWAEQ